MHSDGTVVNQVSISDDRKVTTVALKFLDYDYVAVGTSICHPDDTFDADTGYRLAYGRALANAARFFKSTAWKRVPK